jgi:hypothetical protein
MSASKHVPKSPPAEWRVVLSSGAACQVPASRMRRDKSGGYTFTDDSGPVADFPPMTVVSVERKPLAEQITE